MSLIASAEAAVRPTGHPWAGVMPQAPTKPLPFSSSAAGWRKLCYLAAALVCILHPLRAFQSVISDDAFIAFRYAKHLAGGMGLTWNPGDPPLEGFTSPLHVLLLSAGIRIGLDPLPLSQILGLLGSLLACLGAAWIARELSAEDPRAAPLPLMSSSEIRKASVVKPSAIQRWCDSFAPGVKP